VTNTEQIAVEAVGANTVNANITRKFVVTQQTGKQQAENL